VGQVGGGPGTLIHTGRRRTSRVRPDRDECSSAAGRPGSWVPARPERDRGLHQRARL